MEASSLRCDFSSQSGSEVDVPFWDTSVWFSLIQSPARGGWVHLKENSEATLMGTSEGALRSPTGSVQH